jgi:hypothetical protein
MEQHLHLAARAVEVVEVDAEAAVVLHKLERPQRLLLFLHLPELQRRRAGVAEGLEETAEQRRRAEELQAAALRRRAVSRIGLEMPRILRAFL